jgi:hypothetical protein
MRTGASTGFDARRDALAGVEVDSKGAPSMAVDGLITDDLLSKLAVKHGV